MPTPTARISSRSSVAGRRPRAAASPALRARKSTMIASVAVAPIRVTPSSMTASSASSVRTPPAALTWTCGRGVGAHEAQVLVGGAGRREAGGGLDEVAAGGLGQPAGADLLVVGQVGVLEDHLDDRAGGVGDLDDRRDVGLDVGVAAGLEGPDLDAPCPARSRRRRAPGCASKTLVSVSVVAVREADRRPDRDVGAGEDRRRPADVGRPDADRGDVVLRRQPAAVLDERVVELRPQQRVVDGLGDVALGQAVEQSAELGVSSASGRDSARWRQALTCSTGRRTSRAMRKPCLTFSSVPSKRRSSCSMMQSPS